MKPLTHLHKLQQEEDERYHYYKEKYTKEFLKTDMSPEKREMLTEGIEAVAKDHSVSDYVKLKFTGTLSPTERYLWSSLFKYVHDYEIPLEEFKAIIESYFMPLPTNIAVEDIYERLPKHRWVKLQDDNGKLLVGPFEEMSTQLDFSLIRYIQTQNNIFSEIRRYFNEYELDKNFPLLCTRLRDNLIITNCSFFQFFHKLFLQMTGEVPERVRIYISPDGITQYHSDVFMSFVERTSFYGLKIKEKSPVDVKLLLDGVYSTVKIMQGYCAFVSFCSSLLIATMSDEKYEDSLLDMMCFFLREFHNAYIFRIEIPAAPLDEKLGIENRGSEDHTTRMKIYLFDRKRVPYVIRVDMPHKGDGNENKLHFNVETIEGESPLNHTLIDCVNTNPADLLTVMIENMRRMSPGILEIKDSYKEDDKQMLNYMKAFNAYDDLCMAYYLRKDDQVALEEFNARTGSDCKTVEDGIQEGFLFFSTL